MAEDDERQSSIRKGLLDHLHLLSAGWSVNGRDVSFVTNFDLGAEVGGFLAVGTPAGERLLVQVTGLATAVRDDVRVEVDLGRLGGVDDAVRGASVGMKVPYVSGEGAVIGTIDGDRIGPVTGNGFTDGTLAPATDAEVRASSPAGHCIGTEIVCG